MVRKSACLQVIQQQSTQNTTNLPLQTYEKNRWTFFLFNTGVDVSLCNNFANSGLFSKVSVPVHIYNSLIMHTSLYSYNKGYMYFKGITNTIIASADSYSQKGINSARVSAPYNTYNTKLSLYQFFSCISSIKSGVFVEIKALWFDWRNRYW